MQVVCAKGSVTRGIDIYQGDVISDITKLKAGGISYAMLKAFEHVIDPKFIDRWHEFQAQGITRGAYDFFHPALDPIQQANKFLSIVGPLGETDTMWCDWETTDGLPTQKDRDAGYAWLFHVEQTSGKTPGIYTGPYFAQALALDSRFARFPLWVAHYGVKCPMVPPPWNSWAFWQTSSTGLIPGIVGHCDTDVFDGSPMELIAFCKGLKVS